MNEWSRKNPDSVGLNLFIKKEGSLEPNGCWILNINQSYIIGRSPDSNIRIDEKLISRKQAEIIYFNKDKIMLKDLNSANGTYINKNLIKSYKENFFTIEDSISFGDVNKEICFELVNLNNNSENGNKNTNETENNVNNQDVNENISKKNDEIKFDDQESEYYGKKKNL